MNTEELTNFIIKELSRQHNQKDIIQKICERNNITWQDAEKLVAQVAAQNKRKIASKQSPLLIFLSIGTLVIGLGLLAYNFRIIFSIWNADLMNQVLSAQSGYYGLVGLVTGLGMTIGGFYGIWTTLAAFFPD